MSSYFYLMRIRTLIQGILPWYHWAVICIIVIALILFLIIRKRFSVYRSIVLGLTIFIGLFLFDALVLNRIGVAEEQSPGFDFTAEVHRLLNGNEYQRFLMLFNIAAFIPLGFCLSEFLSETKKSCFKQKLGYVVLIALSFSLLIESLQIAFRVGLFELTDLVLNVLGAILGAMVSSLGRAFIRHLS